MYKALIDFQDTDGRVYSVGDKYPHEPPEERIQELLTGNNRTGKPVIEMVLPGANLDPDTDDLIPAAELNSNMNRPTLKRQAVLREISAEEYPNRHALYEAIKAHDDLRGGPYGEA